MLCGFPSHRAAAAVPGSGSYALEPTATTLWLVSLEVRNSHVGTETHWLEVEPASRPMARSIAGISTVTILVRETSNETIVRGSFLPLYIRNLLAGGVHPDLCRSGS